MSRTGDAELANALLISRVLDGKGGGREIGWDEACRWQPGSDNEVLWLHLYRTAPGMQEWLQATFGIAQPTAELLISDQTRPRAFREGNALVATLRDLNFNPGSEPEDMISMQLWSDGKRILTLRRAPQQSPQRGARPDRSGNGSARCRGYGNAHREIDDRSPQPSRCGDQPDDRSHRYGRR